MKKRFLTAFFSAALVLTMTTIGSIESKAEDTGVIAIDETNFPDEVFREYVATNFDTDENGSLSQAEADAVSEIDVFNKDINDLTGINYFINLTYLDCHKNNLSTLDISDNANLKTLACQLNNLTTLDLTLNTNLINLNCSNNPLYTLNVSNNNKLEILYCDRTSLSILEVDNNTSLTTLSSNYNRLTSLDLSNNKKLQYLDCSYNGLTTLDVNNNIILKTLICSGNNKLTSLNISNNTSLNRLNCVCDNLTTIDASKQPNLSILEASDNSIILLGNKMPNNVWGSNLTLHFTANSDNNFIFNSKSISIDHYSLSPEIFSNIKDGTVVGDNYNITVTIDAGKEQCSFNAGGHTFIFTAPAENVIPYIITYNLNDGTNNSLNPTVYYVVSDTIILEAPTKEGYTFAGWYTDENFTTKITEIQKGSKKNYNLYAKWIKDTPENGWFEDEDGNKFYFKNKESIKADWLEDEDKWYYFGKDGVAVTDWQNINGSWYYFDKECVMMTGWIELDGNWYYLDNSGAMLTGWQVISGTWYYFYGSGAMAESTWIEGCYVGTSGTWIINPVTEGWQIYNGKWWYQLPDSSYPVNEWKKISGVWYYFDNSGYMATGWIEIIEKDNDNKEYSTWYYMETSGAMKTGWLNDNGTWYYLNDSGVMVTDTVIDGCTINENGVWVQ